MVLSCLLLDMCQSSCSLQPLRPFGSVSFSQDKSVFTLRRSANTRVGIEKLLLHEEITLT